MHLAITPRTQRDVVLIVGRSGSGKSRLAAALTRSHDRLLVQGYAEDFPGIVLAKTLDDFFDRIEGEKFRVHYEPSAEEEGVVFLAAALLKNCTVLIDEADLLPNPKYASYYSHAITRGRHDGTHLYLATVRPYGMPPEIVGQCTHLYSFRMHLPRDLDYIKNLTGDDRIPQIIRTLPRFSYVHWTAETGAIEVVDAKGVVRSKGVDILLP